MDDLNPIADEYADDEMFEIEQETKILPTTAKEPNDPITSWEIGIITFVVLAPFLIAFIISVIQNR